ncbi:MAG TPA: GAF domain-containing sensor histidine kinase, partial [Aggregatilineales bacterium]|nr:GAF domain-containing sensor histidine kinase [Aggregatilineales bacterium]
NKTDVFPQAERDSLDRLASFVSGLVATSVRLSNYEQAIKRFDRFQMLAQSLTDILDSKELLQEIVETAREMLDAQMSVLLDIDPDTGDLHPIAWSGITDEVASLMHSRYKEDLKGLVGWARRPARTADLRTDQRTALATHAVVAGMLSELAVPVLYSDKLFGVLAVETNVHRHFTDEETNLLSALAATAGIALRNAQLFESTQETNRALEKTVADLVISQQQAENARLAAVEANKLKTEFVNNMSHELRTPLNAVINFTRIVLDGHAGPVTDQQKEFLDHVHDSGQHLLGLINDILDLAKIEAGKMQLRREMTPIEPILRGVMSTAVGLTRDKGLVLKAEIAPELPPLDIDGVRIRQVLLNLLSNAAKFTPRGGITMRASVQDHGVLITVEDTGIGIKTEDIPKVFEEFRQIDGSLHRIETGTGLGMPISRRFVELHGGKMWIESEPGKGTTISFTLPIVAAPVEAPMA